MTNEITKEQREQVAEQCFRAADEAAGDVRELERLRAESKELRERAEKAEAEADKLSSVAGTLWRERDDARAGLSSAADHNVRLARERDEARADHADLFRTIEAIGEHLDLEAQALVEDPSVVVFRMSAINKKYVDAQNEADRLSDVANEERGQKILAQENLRRAEAELARARALAAEWEKHANETRGKGMCHEACAANDARTEAYDTCAEELSAALSQAGEKGGE